MHCNVTYESELFYGDVSVKWSTVKVEGNLSRVVTHVHWDTVRGTLTYNRFWVQFFKFCTIGYLYSNESRELNILNVRRVDRGVVLDGYIPFSSGFPHSLRFSAFGLGRFLLFFSFSPFVVYSTLILPYAV